MDILLILVLSDRFLNVATCKLFPKTYPKLKRYFTSLFSRTSQGYKLYTSCYNYLIKHIGRITY